jgi:hypothetical protein
MPRALLVFIDGIGVGRPGAHNPFDGAPISILAGLSGDTADSKLASTALDSKLASTALDSTLGYPGLPQSATGQAVLFTGEDAIGVAGGHASGVPSARVAQRVTEKSLLRQARERGKSAGFLNGYDAARAERLGRVARGEERAPRHRGLSCSTVAAFAGGGALRTFDDVRGGRAATFDLTGEACRAHGVDAPIVTLKESARAIARGAGELDLALFEMFLTDMAGHAQDMTWARREIVRVDRFLEELFASIDPEEQLVVVTSDHGNLEDLSTRSHTRARVPLLAFGAGARDFVDGASSLLDVTPRLLTAILRRAERKRIS